MSAHEQMEHAEHAEHAAEHNKKIALLIAVLALFLAFSETLGKSAQTEGIGYNVEASNLWAFFQAKTIRRTLVQTAAEELKVRMENGGAPLYLPGATAGIVPENANSVRRKTTRAKE